MGHKHEELLSCSLGMSIASMQSSQRLNVAMDWRFSFAAERVRQLSEIVAGVCDFAGDTDRRITRGFRRAAEITNGVKRQLKGRDWAENTLGTGCKPALSCLTVNPAWKSWNQIPRRSTS